MRPRCSVLTGLAACLLLGPLAATAQDDMLWRQVAEENTVYMELQEGLVVLELNPAFAPKTVQQFKRLVQEDFYRGLSFYRVIEGFVAQGGDESDIGIPTTQPSLKAEFEISWDDELPWMRVEQKDFYRAETGFIDGFAAARSGKKAWLTHCPGVVAMARETDPDSSRTDFYIVIGQAPRYLDRNLTIFARVIYGMDVVQRIRRGPIEQNGIIENDLDRSRIVRMHMAAEVEVEQKKDFYVMDTSSKGFKGYMDQRRNRKDDFFHQKPPKVLDVCQVPVGIRAEKADVPEQLLTPLLEQATEDSPGEAGG